MIVLTKNEVSMREFPIMSRSELESNWKAARSCFDEALANKTGTDRIYLAAANRLNTLERQVRRMAQQDAVAKRRAERGLLLIL